MSCPSCGTSATCPQCSKGPSSDSWGSAFGSWGSSSGEWGKAPAVAASNWGGVPSASEQPNWGGGGAVATAPSSAGPPEAPVDGWGSAPASPMPAPRKVESSHYQPDGWGATEASAVPVQRGPSLLSPSPEENEEGWLTSPATAKMGKTSYLDDFDDDASAQLAPGKALPPQWDDDVEDDWIDKETGYDPGYDPGSDRSPDPVAGGQGFLWVAVVIATLSLGFGVWSLNKGKVDNPASAQTAEVKIDPIESRHMGRRLAIAGMTGIKADPEAASLQLKGAVKALKEGGASPLEVARARRLWAQALIASGSLVEGGAQWRELSKVPQFKSEAGVALKSTKVRALASADAHLAKARSFIQSGHYNEAILHGKDALRLYEVFDEKGPRRGKAHGAIGRAYLELRRNSLALEHFTSAQRFNPGGDYEAILGSLRSTSSKVDRATPQPTSQPIVITVKPTGPSGPEYPAGTVVHSSGGGGSQPAAQPSVVESAPVPGNTNSPSTFTPPPAKEPKRHTVRNTLNMDDNSGTFQGR